MLAQAGAAGNHSRVAHDACGRMPLIHVALPTNFLNNLMDTTLVFDMSLPMVFKFCVALAGIFRRICLLPSSEIEGPQALL